MHSFLSTAHLAFEWRLLLLGAPAAAWQRLPALAIAAGSKGALQLPLSRAEVLKSLSAAAVASAPPPAAADAAAVPPLLPTPADALVEVRAVLAAATPWAPAGHVIALDQLAPLDAAALPAATPDQLTAALRTALAGGAGGSGALRVEQAADGTVVVSGGKGLQLEVSGQTGCISRYSVNNKQLLAGPLAPCFFRATTDNDRGGSGGSSYAARWIAAGLDRLAVEGPISVKVLPSQQKGGGGGGSGGWDGAVIEAEFVLKPSAAAAGAVGSVAGAGVGETGGAHWMAAEAAAATSSADQVEDLKPAAAAAAQAAAGGQRSAEGEVRVTVTYRVHASGLVETEWRIDARDALPAPLPAPLKASLPRVGLHVEVDGALGARVQWRGRGPHECYPDRKLGAAVRRHEM